MKYFKIGLTSIVLISLLSVIVMTDMSVIWTQLEMIGLNFIIILGLSSMSFFLGSIAWKYCFYQPDQISLGKLFYIRTIGEVISFINPTSIVAGEASKIHLLDDVDMPLREKVDSILLSRIVLISTQLTLSVLCLLWITSIYGILGIGLLFTILSILIIVGMYLLCTWALSQKFLVKQNKATRLIYYLGLLCKKFIRRIKQFARNRKKQMCMAILITIIHWGVGASELYYILHLLDVKTTLANALSVDMGIVLLKSAAGFIPGQIGIEELGNKVLLELIGISTVGVWISVSIIRRARQLFWILLSACFYFLKSVRLDFTFKNFSQTDPER